MEMDSSVGLTTDNVIDIVSELGPDEFAAKILSLMPEDARTADLGCGRIFADYSIMMRTRYVLCDIYEEGSVKDSEGCTLKQGDLELKKYHIEIKSGKKNSRVGDAVYCVMFLLAFWFLRSYFTQGFNIIFLILTALLAVSVSCLIWSGQRDKFGPDQCRSIRNRIDTAFNKPQVI